MSDRLTKRLGALVLTGATLAASCGGRLTSFDLPDGGRVKFTRGALCDKVDLSTFNHNFLNPPRCKQEFIGEYPHEYPDPNPPCCAECDAWAKGFGVPFTLSVFCAKNTRETNCRITNWGFNFTGPELACDPSRDDADRYCSELWSQLVRDPDVEVYAKCTRGLCDLGEPREPCPCQNPQPKSIGLGRGDGSPPTPVVCVKRDGKYTCEPWCQ